MTGWKRPAFIYTLFPLQHFSNYVRKEAENFALYYKMDNKTIDGHRIVSENNTKRRQ